MMTATTRSPGPDRRRVKITMDNELLDAKIPAMEGNAFGPQEVETMSQTLSPSVARCYGLAREHACGGCRAPASIALARDAAEHNCPSPWSGRGMLGRGAGRPYPPEIAASRLHGEGYLIYGRDCASRASARAPPC